MCRWQTHTYQSVIVADKTHMPETTQANHILLLFILLLVSFLISSAILFKHACPCTPLQSAAQ